MLNREFSTEESWMAEKHLKKCSNSLVIRKCKSKQLWDYISHQSECLRSKPQVTAHAREDMMQGEHSSIVSENANLHSHFGNQFGDFFFQKTGRNSSSSRPSYTTPGHIPKRYPSISQGYLSNYIHSSFISSSQNLEVPQLKNR